MSRFFSVSPIFGTTPKENVMRASPLVSKFILSSLIIIGSSSIFAYNQNARISCQVYQRDSQGRLVKECDFTENQASANLLNKTIEYNDPSSDLQIVLKVINGQNMDLTMKSSELGVDSQSVGQMMNLGDGRYRFTSKVKANAYYCSNTRYSIEIICEKNSNGSIGSDSESNSGMSEEEINAERERQQQARLEAEQEAARRAEQRAAEQAAAKRAAEEARRIAEESRRAEAIRQAEAQRSRAEAERRAHNERLIQEAEARRLEAIRNENNRSNGISGSGGSSSHVGRSESNCYGHSNGGCRNTPTVIVRQDNSTTEKVSHRESVVEKNQDEDCELTEIDPNELSDRGDHIAKPALKFCKKKTSQSEAGSSNWKKTNYVPKKETSDSGLLNYINNQMGR